MTPEYAGSWWCPCANHSDARRCSSMSPRLSWSPSNNAAPWKSGPLPRFQSPPRDNPQRLSVLAPGRCAEQSFVPDNLQIPFGKHVGAMWCGVCGCRRSMQRRYSRMSWVQAKGRIVIEIMVDVTVCRVFQILFSALEHRRFAFVIARDCLHCPAIIQEYVCLSRKPGLFWRFCCCRVFRHPSLGEGCLFRRPRRSA